MVTLNQVRAHEDRVYHTAEIPAPYAPQADGREP